MRVAPVTYLGLFLLSSAIVSPLLGQTAPLEQNQKAVLVFDLQMDRFLDSELATSLGLADQIAGMAAQQGDDGPDPTTIKRVSGALSAPESMASAQDLAMGGMPMQFFVKVQFIDSASASDAFGKIVAKEPPSFERDGKTYYRQPGDDGSKQTVMHQRDETTLEFGTETYVFHPTQQVFTDGLVDAWKMAPEGQAIRLALDVEGLGGLLGEAVELGKQGGNPLVGGYLDLVDNMKNLRLAIDVSGDNLFSLQATGVDSENAEELRSGLDSLLGMAKMGGMAQIGQMKEQDPDTAAVAEELLKSLKATAEGSEVSVVIPKPAGFDEAVKNAAQNFGPGGAPPQIEE
jgi:hypothetical protein